jgi:hypothetical protein
VASVLSRTYRIVPVGDESSFMNFDDELTELLSQDLIDTAIGPLGKAVGSLYPTGYRLPT